MNSKILDTIQTFSATQIPSERKAVLQLLVGYLRQKVTTQTAARLNFICTHNSRRSHLAQIWAQTMAYYFGVKNLSCFSGGTEATAMFPKIVETLKQQGFEVYQLTSNQNPIYAVKYDPNEMPVVCFSKVYNDPFNPTTNFGAVMTCDSADEACPLVFGAEARFSVKYADPKAFDDTDLQTEKYAERSLEIGQEMWWVMSQLS